MSAPDKHATEGSDHAVHHFHLNNGSRKEISADRTVRTTGTYIALAVHGFLGHKFAPPRIMEEPRCEVVLDTPHRTVRRQNADVGKSREELAEMQCYTIE